MVENVALAAGIECDRQGVGVDRLIMLLEGWQFIKTWSDLSHLTIGNLCELAGDVEPKSEGRIRRTPVTFQHGGPLAPYAAAEELLEIAIQDLYEERVTTKEFIKEFLWIHPFMDGNGRVAWLLQNWLEGTLDEPRPLYEFRW